MSSQSGSRELVKPALVSSGCAYYDVISLDKDDNTYVVISRSCSFYLSLAECTTLQASFLHNRDRIPDLTYTCCLELVSGILTDRPFWETFSQRAQVSNSFGEEGHYIAQYSLDPARTCRTSKCASSEERRYGLIFIVSTSFCNSNIVLPRIETRNTMGIISWSV